MLKIGEILPTRAITETKKRKKNQVKTQDSQKEKENEKAQEITERH